MNIFLISNLRFKKLQPGTAFRTQSRMTKTFVKLQPAEKPNKIGFRSPTTTTTSQKTLRPMSTALQSSKPSPHVYSHLPLIQIPPKIRKKEVLTEFEMFFQRLHDQTVESPEAPAECRAELQYQANKTVSTKPDLSTFPLSPEHMKTLNDLKRNKDIIITRPDKGRATVVLDKTDYVDKMMTILPDETKCFGLSVIKICLRSLASKVYAFMSK